MKCRIILGLLIFIVTSIQCLAQNSGEALNTVLFKITKENTPHTSYIFGSHHAFGKAFFDTLTIANQALSSCDLLIKENLNIPGETAEDLINKRVSRTKWSKYLNEKDLTFLRTLFASSPTDYTKMTPTEMYVFLNRHFKQTICLKKDPDAPSLSLDDYIGSIAIEQNISRLGLETTEEQIALINQDVAGMPRKKHKRRLANIIDKMRSENSNSCEEIDWYANMEIDYKRHQACRNALILSDRNSKWMIVMREKLQSNNCFIVIGLSHLMYQCGLLNQLKELGYTISPIGLN